MRALLLLTVAMLPFALLPNASAQGNGSALFLHVAADGAPIAPDTGFETVHLQAEYHFANSAEAAAASGSTIRVVVDRMDCASPAVVIVGTHDIAIDVPVPNLQGTLYGTAQYQIRATREAPGLRPVLCTFKAHSESNSPMMPPSAAPEASFTVVVDYSGAIRVTAPIRTAEAGWRSIAAFPVQIENLANAQTMVHFTLVGDVPKGWSPIVPDSLVLGSENWGDTKTNRTAVFSVATPVDSSQGAASATFALRVVPYSTLDVSKELAPADLVFMVHAGGGSAPVVPDTSHGKIAPGAGILFALGLLAAAAIARRRA